MKFSRVQEWWSNRQADVLIVCCIAIFFIAFFPHVIFGNRFIIAGDALYYSYPLRTVAWQMISSGQLPLWTPYVLSGYPLLSMAQVAVGYPLTWGYLFIHGHWAEQIYVLAPFLLSPIFTYAYARELGRSHLASLLAGLAFGYGGMMCGFIANSGMLTNSLMWSPLQLVFIERSRSHSFAYSFSRASLVYALSVLGGHGQSYVYVGVLACWYGLFLSLSSYAANRSLRNWINWRPLAVALGSLLLSACLAAFQLFESLRAARRSIRSSLTFQVFGEGSFLPREALLSIGAQLYHYVDTGAYVAPLAILFAVIAVGTAWRFRGENNLHIWFWTVTAVVAFLLMLGSHTPLYRIVFFTSVLNQFRVPSRHTFEWTLALSILAAYGWDIVNKRLDQSKSRRELLSSGVIVGLILVAIACVVASLWWKATSKPPVPNLSIYTGLPESVYWLWKLAFTIVVVALVWFCFRFKEGRISKVMQAACIMLACFAEPNATVSCWWGRQLSLSAERLQQVSPTTRYLQRLPAVQNRVYTRAGLFAEEFKTQPRLEAPNLHAVYGLHNLAGMEPLILERYSRALGGIGPDSVTPRPGFPPNVDLFGAQSHVLDILNTTQVVTFSGLKTFEDAVTYKNGIGLAVADLDINLLPGQRVQLEGHQSPADQFALVTSLSNSVEEQQGTPVAKVRLLTTNGENREIFLRAGIESAEWAYDRSDVSAIIKHAKASVFDSRPGDAANSFASHRYWAVISFPSTSQISSLEIQNLSQKSAVALWRASLYDSSSRTSASLTYASHSAFWKTVYDQEQVQILENHRAMPRAWLVMKAEAVDGEEALRRIRGESTVEFDPSSTALLEIAPTELPQLSGKIGESPNDVRITNYEPNRLRLETNASGPSVVVISEIFYPGWSATIDGQPARILLTDFLLRGLALPAGHHTVEMRYEAPAARTGAVISGLSLVLLAILFGYSRRRLQVSKPR